MTGPWEEYRKAAPEAADDAPWKAYQRPKADTSATAKRSRMNGILRRVDAGVRGAADMLSLGFADEAAAGIESIPAFVKGGAPAYADEFKRRVTDERSVDQQDRQEVPVARGAGQVGGFAAGMGLTALSNAAVHLPQVAATANPLLRGAVNAGYAAAEGATMGGLSAAGNAEGDLGERAKEAVPGAIAGGVLGAVASPVLGLAQRGIRALASRGAPQIARVANILAERVNPQAARERANVLIEAGAQPSLVSAGDESLRGLTRAAASRMTPAREIVQQRAEAAALNLPDRMGQQARRVMSNDPRAPREIAEQLGQQRATTADANFGAVREEAVQMSPETINALRGDAGRSAISEAARRERDPETRAALLRLAGDALDDPSTPITVGMADRISRVLLGQARVAARQGDDDLAATLGNLGRDVRRPTAAAVPGYQASLDEYGVQSRLMEAADRGGDFLARNTDEFAADAGRMTPEEQQVARATGRRAIESAAGENIAAAPGVARKIADAPEQQMRNRALLGEEDATRLQDGMRAEARVVRDLQDVAPRTGSQTQNKTADQAALSSIASAARDFASGPAGWASWAVNRLKTLGLSDRDAQAIAEVATDPAQLDAVLARLEAGVENGPEVARGVVSALNQSIGKNAGEGTVEPAYRIGPDGTIEIDINKGNPNAPR